MINLPRMSPLELHCEEKALESPGSIACTLALYIRRCRRSALADTYQPSTVTTADALDYIAYGLYIEYTREDGTTPAPYPVFKRSGLYQHYRSLAAEQIRMLICSDIEAVDA